ncbi:hypothetical protein RVW00_000750 [Enterobacter bugandensis]|nr:hypothetical protein [Enterobacter bugandensis]
MTIKTLMFPASIIAVISGIGFILLTWSQAPAKPAPLVTVCELESLQVESDKSLRLRFPEKIRIEGIITEMHENGMVSFANCNGEKSPIGGAILDIISVDSMLGYGHEISATCQVKGRFMWKTKLSLCDAHHI